MILKDMGKTDPYQTTRKQSEPCAYLLECILGTNRN